MKQILNVIFITLITIIFFGASCNPPQVVQIDSPDTILKLDSLKRENQQLKDLLADSTRFHFIDSTVIHFIDSTLIDTNWVTLFKDSVVYHFVDSLRIKDTTITKIVMRDSVNIIDSIAVFQRESYLLGIDTIKVDTSRTDNLVYTNLLDTALYYDRDYKGTRWAVPGYPHQVMIWFDTTYVVTDLWLNVFAWDEGYTVKFKVYYFSDLELSDSTKPELWSKHKVFYSGSHLYLDILDGKNDWTDIAGIKVFGYKK